ncbi:2-haloalkanoic acid dehalogenase [Lachnellula hyalina]|uniref:2-haloalkanoic acid dehalogenase n=1 Tax=Lachnellula hyalina TaxID=1316788 RepID=A0A8H8R990_9HELO|nr:2-haloalkanoic acid dehalogenase [Lachnellula hyalina]TVY30872.1 2-haloalkanoic acid dehalogenase [Lachnellula hyalina]
MSSGNKTVIAFDLYGTLLSTESIAKELATHFGDEKAQSVAALWRRQVSIIGLYGCLYKPFSEITNTSLRHALDELSLSLSDTDVSKLMTAYDSLGTFPDVPPALKALASNPSIDAYVFSNGTDAMVSSSVNQSPSLSSHTSVFKGIVTVEEVKAYKPDPKVYTHLAEKVGKKAGDMADIWLVSGNPFDVVGARAASMQAAWIDRAGGHHGKGGWTDKLGELASGGPTVIVKGVDEAVNEIQKRTKDNGGKSGAGFNNEAAALGPG